MGGWLGGRLPFAAETCGKAVVVIQITENQRLSYPKTPVTPLSKFFIEVRKITCRPRN
jgi:hypothetical protein